MTVHYPGASSGHLLDAVMSRASEVLSPTMLPAKDGTLVPIKVERSYFDPEKYEDYELPALMVRFTGATQQVMDRGGEERIGNVEMVLGVYLADYGDDEFAIALMERIEQSLLSQRILDRKYRLVMPLSWSVPDAADQPWPYWWATMTTSYYMPTISEVADENGNALDI